MTHGQHSMGWCIISHTIFPFILEVKKNLCGLQVETEHGCSVSWEKPLIPELKTIFGD